MKRIIKFYKDEKLLVSSPLKGGSDHKERIAFANLLGLNDDWTHCVLDGINDSDRYGHYRSTHEDASPYWTTFDKDGVEIKEEPPSTTRVDVLDEVLHSLNMVYSRIYVGFHEGDTAPQDAFNRDMRSKGFRIATSHIEGMRNLEKTAIHKPWHGDKTVEVLDEVISILEEGHQNYCSSGDGFFIELEAIGFANAIKLVKKFRNKQGG